MALLGPRRLYVAALALNRSGRSREAGIVLTLAGHSFPTGKPTSPLVLFQVHQAVRIDAGAGEVTFIDSSGALFNGASTYDLVNQYQWATFIWDGSNWTVIGN